LGTFITIKRVLSKLFLDSDVNLIKQALVGALLIVPNFFLIASLITVLRDDVTVELEVENQMLNNIVSLEVAILIREFGGVMC